MELSLYDSRIFEALILVHLMLSEASGMLPFAGPAWGVHSNIQLTREPATLCFAGFCSCVVLSPFSHVQFFVTLWTIACQAPLSMRLSRQEYWSGLPCPPPRDLPHPWVEPASLTSPVLAGGFFSCAVAGIN